MFFEIITRIYQKTTKRHGAFCLYFFDSLLNHFQPILFKKNGAFFFNFGFDIFIIICSK